MHKTVVCGVCIMLYRSSCELCNLLCYQLLRTWYIANLVDPLMSPDIMLMVLLLVLQWCTMVIARFEGRELGDPNGQMFLGMVHVIEFLSVCTCLDQIMLEQGCLLLVLLLNLFLVLAISNRDIYLRCPWRFFDCHSNFHS
jgi:hypothetical protein